MRRVVTAVIATGILVAGPLAGLASAEPPIIGEIPSDGCELSKKLGVVYVRECGDPDPDW